MPNYEIYYGDAMNVVTGCANGLGREIRVDGTDYYIARAQNTFKLKRGGLNIGSINARVEGPIVRIGQLDLNNEWRGPNGLSNLLCLVALTYGVQGRATGVTLAEVTTTLSNSLWGRLGLSEGPVMPIATVLGNMENYQEKLAVSMGLARSPQTILVNTDIPQGANVSVVVKRKLSM